MNRAILLLPVLAAPPAAQTTFTSPPGFVAREGPTSTASTHFAYYAASRTQYLDGGQRGTPRANIDQARFRRDAAASPTLYAPRTVNAGFLLAHCDLVANPTPSTTFATNYKTTPTQVYTVKPTNLPDHGPQPRTMPAPWDVVFLFDAPFSYNGSDDLLYEVTGNGNVLPAAPYNLDAVSGNAAVGGGTGDFRYNGWTACVVPPNRAQFDILSEAPRTHASNVTTMSWNAERGPVSSPAVLALGLSDPNLSGPFCAPLRTSAEVVVPAGTTTATGTILPVGVSFPAPVGPVDLYGQFAAVEPTALALYLSDATQHLVVPYTPSTTLNVWRVQNASSDTAAMGSTPSRASIPVVEFRHP
jgi:hypothetical protein